MKGAPLVSHSKSKPSATRVADLTAQRVVGFVERNAEGLEPDAPVLTGRLAHELRPQRIGADLERGAARQGHLVITHHHRANSGPQQVGPEPGDAFLAMQREPNEPSGAVTLAPLEAP